MSKMSLLDTFSDEEFKDIVLTSSSIKEVCMKLGYVGHSGANGNRIKNRMAELGLNETQFKTLHRIDRNVENVFIENSTAAQKTLRSFYEKGNYTPYICAICGQQPFWNNKPLVLILDHINGKNHDNRLTNLRWVCPNCNYQLETTNSKNWVYQRQQAEIEFNSQI